MEIHEIGVHITIPNFIMYFTCLKMPCFQAFPPFYVILLHLIFLFSIFVCKMNFLLLRKQKESDTVLYYTISASFFKP